MIYPPEVLEESGGTLEFEEWAKLVGTGPYELTDWVEGSSMTYVKNPNYWGYDEKYPENRLPYIDGLRFLMMPEEATRLAAMRSGKIDFLHVAAGTQIKSIDTLVSLMRRPTPKSYWSHFHIGRKRLLLLTRKRRPLTTSGCARQCRWHWTSRQLTIPTLRVMATRDLRRVGGML